MSTATLATSRMKLVDLDQCWRLDQRCFGDGEVYDRATFRDLLTHRDSLCFKSSTEESQMIGFVIGVLEPDHVGHVVVLGVAPGWRRQGIASQLMQRVEQAFRDHKVQLIHLEVRTSNRGAQELYKRLGFRIAGRRLSYYNNGDDGFLMVKQLKEAAAAG